ncbi:MAG: AAA family ATPase, partial [Butyrivibrio sp.]|nr:AAA family ATPase [Butyrivibrio sp.]
MADQFLNNMYNDFFGSGARPGKKEGSAGDKSAAAGVTTDEAMAHADDALAEARALFGTKKEEEAAPPPEPETDPMEDLEALVGLASIKNDVRELADFVRVQKMRQDQGMKSVPVSLHLVFTGNPGTGKTTVARIIARLYKQIGVLSKGQLVEVDRSGLVAGYVGQTALKTQEQIKKALGGVLFIDEAYALSQNDQDSFGQEAIDTILKAMEDHRDDLVVIVAGYTAPMETFINSNPGLKSRFNKYIEFPDYSTDELEQIFRLNMEKYDYTADDDVMRQIRALITLRKLQNLENYANARDVRNLFEQIVTNQARRVADIEGVTQEQLREITLEDLVEPQEGEQHAEAPQKSVTEAPEESAETPEQDTAETLTPQEQGESGEEQTRTGSVDAGDEAEGEEPHERGDEAQRDGAAAG